MREAPGSSSGPAKGWLAARTIPETAHEGEEAHVTSLIISRRERCFQKSRSEAVADGQDEERLFHEHPALNYWGELEFGGR